MKDLLNQAAVKNIDTLKAEFVTAAEAFEALTKEDDSDAFKNAFKVMNTAGMRLHDGILENGENYPSDLVIQSNLYFMRQALKTGVDKLRDVVNSKEYAVTDKRSMSVLGKAIKTGK